MYVGKHILCFDRCQLTTTWMSSIKGRYEPRLNIYFNLLGEVWPPSCATPSSSCVRAHEQYRYN